QVLDRLDDVGGRRRVDRVRGPDPLGRFQPARLQVDGDDRGAAGDVGGHDGGEAQGADAEDDEARPGVRVERVEDGDAAGLDAAAERAERLQGRAPVDLDHVAAVGQGVG